MNRTVKIQITFRIHRANIQQAAIQFFKIEFVNCETYMLYGFGKKTNKREKKRDERGTKINSDPQVKRIEPTGGEYRVSGAVANSEAIKVTLKYGS